MVHRLLLLSLLAACGSPPQTCATCTPPDGGPTVMDGGLSDAGATLPAVVINELSSLDGDFIELLNRSAHAVELSGSTLAHRGPDGGPERSDAAPLTGVIIAPGQYLVVNASPDAGVLTFSFNISNGSGDTVFLLGVDGGVVDEVTFPPDGHNAGESWGRLPDGTGAFQRLTARTPGAVNR